MVVRPKLGFFDRFERLRQEQLGGLKALTAAARPLPYLMILYATLDVFAYIWGEGTDREAGPRFRGFCEKYITLHLAGITAYDLWGARCSVLHTASPDSSTSKGGEARRLLYSWRSERINVLKEIIRKAPNPGTFAEVSFQSLEQALGSGLNSFLKDLKDDPKLRSHCEPKLNEIYSIINIDNGNPSGYSPA